MAATRVATVATKGTMTTTMLVPTVPAQAVPALCTPPRAGGCPTMTAGSAVRFIYYDRNFIVDHHFSRCSQPPPTPHPNTCRALLCSIVLYLVLYLVPVAY